jgi:hypothetical protein
MGIIMLKITKFKENEIVSVKLISGEEIVTKLGKPNDDFYVFIKPVVLSVTPQGMGLAPYIMTADANKLTINVHESKIIAMAKSQDAVIQQYTKATTGIITTSKPGVIT